jgi:hypothetical protein
MCCKNQDLLTSFSYSPHKVKVEKTRVFSDETLFFSFHVGCIQKNALFKMESK